MVRMKSLKVNHFGTTPLGEPVDSYTLTNDHGVEVTILSFGGIIQSLKVPNRMGVSEDVVLGFDNLNDYVHSNSPYFGAIIGRCGNRIANGKFVLDGVTYHLVKNNSENHLHGGKVGFNAVVWSVEDVSTEESPRVKLSYLSKDGEEGYPGNLNVEVMYALTDDNAIEITYRAITDKTTVINLTHHSYFNFNLASGTDILNHQVQLSASQFVPVNDAIIPTGELQDVKDSPFDFLQSKTIGVDIGGSHPQLIRGNGFDHCWVVDAYDATLKKIASVYDPISGRKMEVLSTEPGVQLYSGNFLNGMLVGKNGQKYHQRMGLCLETQHFPDSPNQDQFPSVVLNVGDEYTSKTVYKFTV